MVRNCFWGCLRCDAVKIIWFSTCFRTTTSIPIPRSMPSYHSANRRLPDSTYEPWVILVLVSRLWIEETKLVIDIETDRPVIQSILGMFVFVHRSWICLSLATCKAGTEFTFILWTVVHRMAAIRSSIMAWTVYLPSFPRHYDDCQVCRFDCSSPGFSSSLISLSFTPVFGSFVQEVFRRVWLL